MSTETDAVTPDRQEANRRYAEQFNEAARVACTTYLDGIGTWGPVRKAQEFDALDAAGQTVWRAVADRAAHAMPARPDAGGATMTALSETLQHLSPPDRVRAMVARLPDSDAVTVDKADLLAILDTWQDCATAAWWAWHDLDRATTVTTQGQAAVELSNHMCDLASWLPNYDTELGRLRYEEEAAPMTDSTAARFTVYMAPLNGAGVAGRFNVFAVSAVEAGRQVRAELAGMPIASEWMPWLVCDSAGEEVWHFTDGPLEEKR